MYTVSHLRIIQGERRVQQRTIVKKTFKVKFNCQIKDYISQQGDKKIVKITLAIVDSFA
jgi:hypothetical protein